jgi:hypothetical protein
MKFIKVICILTSLFLATVVTAQDVTHTTSNETGGVVVHKDARIDALIKKQGSINKNVKKSTARTGRGYRLLVVNTNKREEAIDAKTKVYTYFPELKAYLSYQTPYFKLKAGNFKTRDEAERYRKNMMTIFPKGVFIVNDTIEIKPEKEDSED